MTSCFIFLLPQFEPFLSPFFLLNGGLDMNQSKCLLKLLSQVLCHSNGKAQPLSSIANVNTKPLTYGFWKSLKIQTIVPCFKNEEKDAWRPELTNISK